MNKVIGLSIALFCSTSLFASEISFGVLKTMFPNESVKEFTLADINNDGNTEIVIITNNGELKYAEKIGGGLLIDEDLSYLMDTDGWDITTPLSGAKSPSLYIRRGKISISETWGDAHSRCVAEPKLEHGHIVARSYDGEITITSMTKSGMTGTLTCTDSPLSQSQEIPFTAIKR